MATFTDTELECIVFALLVILVMSFFYVSKKINISFFITLVGFALIANPINIQAKENISKPFEGKWLDCSFVKYGVHKKKQLSCDGFYLVQRGKNICGNWDSIASDQDYGQIQAIEINSKEANITNICGDFKEFSQIHCKNEPYFIGVDKTGWESPSGHIANIQICHSKLFGGLSACNKYKKTYGYKKQKWSNSERKKFISNPWVSACLAGKDLKDSNL